MLKTLITNHKQEKKRRLVIKRRDLKTQVRRRIRELQQLIVDQITKILEESKGNKRAFEAQRLLKKTCRKPCFIRDDQGHLSHNPHHVIPILTNYYTSFFNQNDHMTTSPFDSTNTPKPLGKPINEEETENALAKQVMAELGGQTISSANT